MKWLESFWETNSVILSCDPFATENSGDLESFIEQIQEVKRYYTFTKLESIADRLRKKKRQGFAAICFQYPRKGVLMQAVPFLLEEKIPFTVFLHVDGIGTNRLPFEETLALYARKHPEALSPTWRAEQVKLTWDQPEHAESCLAEIKKRLGPLPLEHADPLAYFSTWGKLTEIPQEAVEWGMVLSSSPHSARQPLENEILFMRQMLGVAPKVARTTQGAWRDQDLQALSLRACLGLEEGAVTHSSDPFNLPLWRFST